MIRIATLEEVFIIKHALKELQDRDRRNVEIAKYLDDPRGVDLFEEEIEKINEMLNSIERVIK